MNQDVKKFLKIFGITVAIGLVCVVVFLFGAVMGYWGNLEDIDVEALTLQQNSSIVYVDKNTGEEVVVQKLSADENRDWASIEDIPEDLQHAFVAIEDERFYEHKGFDVKRTGKATMTWVWNKITGKSGTSLGGSTISQQLIKNITGENDQTPARKIQEISRAIALEKEMSKEQILELYLNCIYLSQGCNGVQTASRLYFDKDVSALSLAECASLAAITQYPSLYDPFVNPDKNKERQETVLAKMLELGYITQEEHDAAVAETLNFADVTEKQQERGTGTTSYFADQVIREVLADLQAEGYSESLANKLVYTGGIKIYTEYDPKVQNAVDNYYENVKNFPDSAAQSAIAVIDVKTGAVVGIAGGIGPKEGSLTLNRASMSVRQPGSSIKPISVYAPALEYGVINPGSIFEDEPKSYNGWTPRNSDYQYRGPVDVRRAVRSSLNTIAVAVLHKMGLQTSFDFVRDKMGITTLVESRPGPEGIITDIGYAQLALGGLTDGVTVMEMAAAYAAFANEGIYNTPHTYTKVVDSNGELLLASPVKTWAAMKSSTAYLMSDMLNDVVTSGTGAGAGVSGVFTAGKTGTTTENKDRWFVGYTPYYSAAVWYGYDIPQEIRTSSNPGVTVFRNVMNEIHRGLGGRSLVKPSDVISLSYCTESGLRATEECPSAYGSFIADAVPKYCGLEEHEADKEKEGEEGEEGAEGEDGAEGESTDTSTPGTNTSSPAPTGTAPSATSGALTE